MVFTCTEIPEIISMKDILFQVSELSILLTSLFKIDVSSAVSSGVFNTFCEMHCTSHSGNLNPINCKLLQYGQADDVKGPGNDSSTLPYLKCRYQKDE